MATTDLLRAHEASGRRFVASGVASFALDAGDGAPVLCLHGVPASSFLWRKVVPELAARGLRGIAPDLPGMGLAERPATFDYSWAGLGGWLATAVDALGLDRFHLVVHDIGGPVGFDLLARLGDRIETITVLNTLVAVDGFTKPWPMRPFGLPVIGDLWLRSLVRQVFVPLFRAQGLYRQVAMSNDEIACYVDLLKRDDGGAAFLRIMRSFQTDAATEARYRAALDAHRGRRAVVWGEHDPSLPLADHGATARELVGPDLFATVPGRHFLQEDNAAAIADVVAELVALGDG